MAIDFGKRHIGLAVSDETKTIANGLDTIHYVNRKEMMQKLRNIIKEKEVDKIVLGYPFSMSGKSSSIGLEVLSFRQLLETEFQLPIELLDERFTTEMSKDILREMGKKPIHRKSLIDKISAVIILEDYLQFIKKQ